MNTQGKVFKYPDNVDTDVIIPARYLNTPNAEELALHCMEDIDTEFVKKVNAGDVMVAGWNFGCGSSREHAPLVIKTCKTGCVIAKSFARIFYRNAINIGLPILECEEAANEMKVQRKIEEGDYSSKANIVNFPRNTDFHKSIDKCAYKKPAFCDCNGLWLYYILLLFYEVLPYS